MKEKNSNSKIEHLQGHMRSRIRDILDYFNIEYREYDEWISCPCPIHGGDNPTGFTITIDGDEEYIGFWRCWTRACEKEYYNDILGLIRGLLSIEKGDDASFSEVVSFCEKFIGEDILEPPPPPKTSREFLSSVNVLNQDIEQNKTNITRDKVRERISIPSEYYLNRGFLPETLDKYDVGYCNDRNKPMYSRVVVPVYDDNHEYMIGCVGRRTNNNTMGKWINSKGFKKSTCLYNYWYAKEHILRTKAVILVEGQGDVWRLSEAGIFNAVGMFGCSLSEQQRIILERSGALSLVILTDSDEAGQIGKEKIKQKCDKLFNLYFPSSSSKDVGDMKVEDIKSNLLPQIEGLV